MIINFINNIICLCYPNFRYIDPYNEGSQHVDFVNAVIGETEGYTELVRYVQKIF